MGLAFNSTAASVRTAIEILRLFTYIIYEGLFKFMPYPLGGQVLLIIIGSTLKFSRLQSPSSTPLTGSAIRQGQMGSAVLQGEAECQITTINSTYYCATDVVVP